MTYHKITPWKLFPSEDNWKIIRFHYSNEDQWETFNMLVMRSIEFEADGPEPLTLEPRTAHGELVLRLYMSCSADAQREMRTNTAMRP